MFSSFFSLYLPSCLLRALSSNFLMLVADSIAIFLILFRKDSFFWLGLLSELEGIGPLVGCNSLPLRDGSSRISLLSYFFLVSP